MTSVRTAHTPPIAFKAEMEILSRVYKTLHL